MPTPIRRILLYVSFKEGRDLLLIFYTLQPLGDLQPKECRAIVKSMLNPNPKLRATTETILKDPWMQKIAALAPASANASPAKMPGMGVPGGGVPLPKETPKATPPGPLTPAA